MSKRLRDPEARWSDVAPRVQRLILGAYGIATAAIGLALTCFTHA